jgi:hypothetical protein
MNPETGFQRLSHFETLRGMVLVQQKDERGQNTSRNFDILSAHLPSKNFLEALLLIISAHLKLYLPLP